jgi:2-methylcitrate dehydratase PrpD
MEFTTTIAGFVENLKFSDIPGEVLERAKQCFLDFVSVAAMATEEKESTPPIERAVRILAGGAGPGTVIAHKDGLPFQYAALLNGALAHTLDFDDTNFRGSLHLGAPILPAVIALSEYRGGRGTDFLTAMVAGYEVACRIAEALGLTAYDRGFHPTSVAGIFGATAAGSKVLGFNSRKIKNGLGLNVSQAAGSMQYLDNGAWNKRLHPGLAAHNAILSLFFSEAGFKGASHPLEGNFGLLRGYCDSPRPEKLVDGLGREWVTLETGLKPYPSCRLTHGIVDAMVELHDLLGPSLPEVQEINLSLSPKSYDIVGEPLPRKIEPQDAVDGQFSVYFQAAAALTDGAVNWESYSRLKDPKILELTRRIKVEKDATLNPRTSKVILKTKKGERHEKLVELPKGEPENPLTWEEVVKKFTSCVGLVFSSGQREIIVRAVRGFEKISDVKSWMVNLRGER